MLIDTNVLLLYITGVTGRRLIETHKRCSNQFDEEDFNSLLGLLEDEPQLMLLPNVFTETSNLIAQIGNPDKDALLRTLRGAILAYPEEYGANQLAVTLPNCRILRLTDCALLAIPGRNLHLLTVDLDLYLAFLNAGRPVTNFRHAIDNRL